MISALCVRGNHQPGPTQFSSSPPRSAATVSAVPLAGPRNYRVVSSEPDPSGFYRKSLMSLEGAPTDAVAQEARSRLRHHGTGPPTRAAPGRLASAPHPARGRGQAASLHRLDRPERITLLAVHELERLCHGGKLLSHAPQTVLELR